MSEIIKFTAVQLSAKLESKELSAVEVVSAHLAQIEKQDSEINAFLAINEKALEAATEVDKARATGTHTGPMAGVPIAIKDVLVTKDMPSTSASKILEGYMSPFDATVVEKVKAAGLVQLGKTNMDEFAMGSTTETSAYGPTKNPWAKDSVPGGSGGGSAAALAAFEAPLAFGSDTGGSIRQPAALTGTVGMKPTFGAVSRYGAIALGSSLDQIGPCGRTVLDTALLHDIIAGHDYRDGVSINQDWTSMAQAAREGASGAGLKGLKVGVINQLQSTAYAPGAIQAGVQSRFDEAITWLSSQGAEIVEIDMPSIEHAVQAYYVIMSAEASSNLAKFDSVRFGLRATPENVNNFEDVMSATRGLGFGPEVKRRVLFGIHALSKGQYDTMFIGAQKARTLVINDFKSAFEQVDVLASITSPVTAWKLRERGSSEEQNYLKDAAPIPANLAGLPAISVPVGLAAEDNLPVGLQLVAPAQADDVVYRLAAAIEQMVTDRDEAAIWQRITEGAR